MQHQMKIKDFHQLMCSSVFKDFLLYYSYLSKKLLRLLWLAYLTHIE